MKKTILMGALALTTISVQAQDLKPVLEKTFLAFDTTQVQDVKIEQSNKLALIAKKWDKEWVTHYYVAYSKATLSYYEKDLAKKDAYLDEAEKEKEEAVSILGKENDETYVLGAMIANFRMGVDPMNRWQKYGQLFSANLESAKELNPDNPRMYYLQGTSKYFTPKAYGGGKKPAQPYFEKAEGLFAKETGGDITKPYWGKEANSYFLRLCKKEDKE
ncbi:MAG: hypothetical protein ACHQD8_05915 [Chitinophagales bacterium]